jgi:hypothetical protein
MAPARNRSARSPAVSGGTVTEKEGGMGEGALRALKVAVVVMGVLIIGGTGLLGVLIARRMSGAPHPVASTSPVSNPVSGLAAGAPVRDVLLDEASGTRVANTVLSGDRMAVTLQGGGPDRVVVLDLRNGRIVARVSLRP